jgi:anti-sigma regulatory factor (Ser/Thr protein kinase)
MTLSEGVGDPRRGLSVGVLAVSHVPQSAAEARRAVGDDLVRNGVDREAVDDVVLVVSELVGNAVLHAVAASDHELHVRWEIEPDAVVVRVVDGTAEMPMPMTPPAEPDAPSGRGLAIVAALARDWGVQCDEHGKQVWARVPTRHLVSA